jgi:hypothetical protein
MRLSHQATRFKRDSHIVTRGCCPGAPFVAKDRGFRDFPGGQEIGVDVGYEPQGSKDHAGDITDDGTHFARTS